jgi:hypothetical protein
MDGTAAHLLGFRGGVMDGAALLLNTLTPPCTGVPQEEPASKAVIAQVLRLL